MSLHLLFKRRRMREQELDEEIRAHLAMAIRERIEQGEDPAEAELNARREFGNVPLVKDVTRDMWGWCWLETLLQDLKYGLRQLRRNPVFTAVAVLTLAIGIGASTAMFSVIECSVFNPFPYAHSHRDAVVVARFEQLGSDYYWGWFPTEEFLDFRAHNHVFEQVIGTRHTDCVFTSHEEALDFDCLEATGNLFEFLGMWPLLGRTFTPADAAPGAPPVAVLAYTTWQSKFGSDPTIVGRTITLNDKPITVIGVMPRRFGWEVADFWVPHNFAAESATGSQNIASMTGHLKPGVSVAQAAAEIQVLAKHYAALHPKQTRGISLSVESLLTIALGWPQPHRILFLLFASVGLLLAIACANVANLLLARATTRGGEIGVRAALGAGRGRLARQFIVESLLLAAAGGLLGCLFAWPGLKALVAILPPRYIPNVAVIRINYPVLLFAAAMAAVATVFFGLAPALFAARKDFQTSLSGAGRGAPGGRHQHVLRNLLVIGEFTFSLILLTGAGLLIRSFIAVRYKDVGFDPSHVLRAVFSLPRARYKTAEQRNLFDTTLLDRLRTLHGVHSAAFTSPPPPLNYSMAVAIKGMPSQGKTIAQVRATSGSFLATLRIPLIEGRDISAEDCHAARKVAVVNQSFVRRYLAGRDPIGREVTVGVLSKPPMLLKAPAFQVIGVAGDSLNNGPAQPAQPSLYIPYTVASFSFGAYLIRTAGAPELLLHPLRHAFFQMDSQLPVDGMSLKAMLDQNWYTEPRFVMAVMSVFAGLGLALVLIGIYSVLSYSVARRTHEIGVRMALGAEKGDVLKMVVGQGLRLALIGVAIGLVGALALTRFLASQLHGVKATDPLTFIAVSLILIAVALAACYIPARRAAKVDPMVALRYE